MYICANDKTIIGLAQGKLLLFMSSYNASLYICSIFFQQNQPIGSPIWIRLYPYFLIRDFLSLISAIELIDIESSRREILEAF